MLVRPESPENVGAVARVIRNTGLHGLHLVAPGDWRTVECWRTAWGAHAVLEQARVHPSLAAALAETALAVGLSGRRDAGVAPVDVRDAAAQVAALGAGQRAALVFGPETSGLSREELALCSLRARIPTHPDQPSLNLSHAAMIAAYEVYRSCARAAPGPRLASHQEKEGVLGLLRAGLLSVGALPAQNSDGYFREWRAMLHRAPLTPRQIELLEHLARKLGARGPSVAGE